jgi:ATP-dependent helicase YprA (DUF1998 family)
VFFHQDLGDEEVGRIIRFLHGDHIKDQNDLEVHRKKFQFISRRLVDKPPHMMIMFYPGKKYLSVAPGFIHVPKNFSQGDLNEFIKEQLEDHRIKTIKFIDQYKQFEEVEKEICQILSLDGIERMVENDFIYMDKLLLATKHLKKFISTNPDVLFPLIRVTFQNKRIMFGEKY